ncbi:MAG: type II toxin-antitoxin system VapC family toxin [Nevskiales bacterium]
MSVLLDTHIWVRWLTPQADLAETERATLDRLAAQGKVFLPAICLWEAQMLHAKGRIRLPLRFPDWLGRATAPNILGVLPLDTDVVIALDALPASFHGDPADRLIVATARAHGLPLATHDEQIRRSRVVRLWKP